MCIRDRKRKIIGAEFIRVFEEEARKLEGIDFLAQGTIYPDIVESGTKTAKVVKSHHTVGGLPEDLDFTLVEPLRQLFKDEVRACGLELGLPYDMVYRQPFPGPGLGVRCLGAITRERLEAVRESDAILREEFANAGLDKKVWQYFTIVPDFKSVGVRDNARCFDSVSYTHLDVYKRQAFLVLSQRMLPAMAIVIPYFLMAMAARLLDTRVILIICYLLFNIPFTIIMMRGFFEDIPMEIEEAGKIDGCNGLQVFKELILPLSLPVLTATAIFCLINSWNEFVFANFLTSVNAKTCLLYTSCHAA